MKRPSLSAVVLASASALLVSGCGVASPTTGSSASTPGRPTASGSAAVTVPGALPSAASCADLTNAMSVPELASQLVVTSASGPEQVTSSVRDARAGGVLLTGQFSGGVTQVRDAVDALHAVSPTALVLVDQEGGTIQPLTGPGFDTIPDAAAQAALGEQLEPSWVTWGGQLKKAGVTMNLAPVADVSASGRLVTGATSYATTPAGASGSVVSVVNGQSAAKVASGLAHFPGEGALTVPSSAGSSGAAARQDTTTTATSPTLAPFRIGVAEGAQAVVVSTATFTNLDADHPAAMSPAVIKLLRDDLKFTGLVVSGDLSHVEGSTASVPDRTLAFVRAGGQLAVVTDPADAKAAVDALAQVGTSDPATESAMRNAVNGVVTLKASQGLVGCQAAKG